MTTLSRVFKKVGQSGRMTGLSRVIALAVGVGLCVSGVGVAQLEDDSAEPSFEYRTEIELRKSTKRVLRQHKLAETAQKDPIAAIVALDNTRQANGGPERRDLTGHRRSRNSRGQSQDLTCGSGFLPSGRRGIL